MAFLQAHTANLTPHPAPVAPLADQGPRMGDGGHLKKYQLIPISV
jgi:hypothetical protein